MGAITLELRCPKIVNGVSIDPNPDWNLDDMLSELNSLELKLNASPINPKSFKKSAQIEFRKAGTREKNGNAFIMRVSDDEMGETDDEEVVEPKSLEPASRFSCNDLYLSGSDDSEDESMHLQVPMEITKVVEGAFLEITHEYQLGIKDDIRNQISALEAELVAEKEKSVSAVVRVEKSTEARREMDRKLDVQYQRKIAEALDNHLTAIQRDHEHRSQIEERRIRDDAALEEAQRKEKALQEDKLRQEKAKAEEEARREAAKRAEQERKGVEEAKRIAKETEDKIATENLAESAAKKEALQNIPLTISAPNVPKAVPAAGNLVRAAVNALKDEERRLQKYKELEERNQSIVSISNTVISSKEREIIRRIKQITGSVAAVRSKANELSKMFNDPSFPQSIVVAIFAQKVISIYETPNANFNSSAFACGHVIVYISAQVPVIMEYLLAELHKACIYTVPKHVVYSKSTFESTDTYFKAIGYRVEDGKLETTEQYLERLGSYMKLYGALVQTESQGVRNLHGLEEGWVWLARFLNNLPANIYTAVALEAFLRMAGYALHQKYKSQFRKILKAISQQFVQALKDKGDSKMNSAITRLQVYIESRAFMKEPEGWRLKDSLLSADIDSGSDYPQQHSYSQNNHYTYGR